MNTHTVTGVAVYLLGWGIRLSRIYQSQFVKLCCGSNPISSAYNQQYLFLTCVLSSCRVLPVGPKFLLQPPSRKVLVRVGGEREQRRDHFHSPVIGQTSHMTTPDSTGQEGNLSISLRRESKISGEITNNSHSGEVVSLIEFWSIFRVSLT